MSKSIRRSLSSLTAVLAASAGAVALVACNGVGKGNSLDRIHIVPSEFGGTLAGIQKEYTDAAAYQCVPRTLNLWGTFTRSDDDIGDFTTRANWSSDDPAIAKVSNGDLESPIDSTLKLGKGVIVAGNTGSTVIRADYLDMQAKITVNVSAPTDITITPANPRVTLHSLQGVLVTAKLGGVETSLTSTSGTQLVKAAFNPASDTLAKVAVSSNIPVVTAYGVTSDPLTLDLTLPYCGQTVSTTVRVAEPTSLVMTREEGFNTNGELIVGTNQRLTLKADFGDGPEQDLTNQSVFSLANDAADTDAAARVAVATGAVSALKAGAAVPVKAVCCAIDLNADGDKLDEELGELAKYSSNQLPVIPVAGDLTSFTIDPTSPTLESGKTQQFTALGTFDSGLRTQPITRSITWSSADTTLATFTNTTATLGLLTALSVDQQKTVVVTATPSKDIDGTVLTTPVTTTVTITPVPTAE